ncbi:MAG: hypothetical protein JW749_03645 [Sedimentisphaerales bacterium]|nr:hypothetical protein [Sedimentisphaerales bacterium]
MDDFQKEFNELCRTTSTLEVQFANALQKTHGLELGTLDNLLGVKSQLELFIADFEDSIRLLNDGEHEITIDYLSEWTNSCREALKRTEEKIEKGDYKTE